MKRRMCRILMATLLVTYWVSVISKHLPYGAANQKVDQKPRIQDVPGLASVTKGTERMKRRSNGYEERLRGLRRVGSTPPRCNQKCRGCVPCNPIQIPATTGHLDVHYTNYEPEGWKCKCGTSYFNP